MHMKMGCIIITASTTVIHIEQEVTLYTENSIPLVNNIQFTCMHVASADVGICITSCSGYQAAPILVKGPQKEDDVMV